MTSLCMGISPYGSIQRFTDTIKTMKKHLDRNWDVMIKLLDEQSILPIQTLSAPHTSTSLCPVVDKPSSSISRKLRTHCEQCLHRQLKVKEILISKQLLKRKFQTILNRKFDNCKQQQALCRKLRIESNLRSQLRDLKKMMAQKDAAIKHLKNENSLLKQTSRWHEISHLKCSKAKMRSVHKRNEQLYKKREVRLKRNNALLQKQIHKLTEENEMLQSEVLSAEKKKSIIAKVDGKTYSAACHKAIYSCLVYQVIIGLHFEHMWFVYNQNVFTKVMFYQ